jgi:hypothetical protein
MHLLARPRTDRQSQSAGHEKSPVLQPLAAECETRPTGLVGDTGLEPGPSSSRVAHFLEDGNAPCDALTVNDPQLQLLIDAWPTLSKAVQQQIMLLVQAES